MNRYRTDIVTLQQFALNRAGKLLSNEYTPNKLLWECCNKHQWLAKWNDIRNGHWCLLCSGKAKLAFDVLEKEVEIRGGILISNEYINNKTSITIQCNEGHIWETKWSIIKNGSWCPFCVNVNKRTLNDIHTYISNKPFIILSTQYKNCKSKLQWKCDKGHIWEAAWTTLQQGHGCPSCMRRIPDIIDLQAFAKTKSGELLSLEYKNSKSKLQWKCDKGHIWEAVWNDIRTGHWCSKCKLKAENSCRKEVELYFAGAVFDKTRFYYDKSNTKKFYEFDGYNKQLKTAFEYHGYQHYIYPNWFHKTEDKFLQSKQRDKDKEQYCKDNNIKLIIIPYTELDIKTYITDFLK